MFSLPGSYDGSHLVGYDDGIRIYNIHNDNTSIDISKYVSSDALYDLDVVSLDINANVHADMPTSTPSKIYELFAYYSDENNRDDIFEMVNDGLLGYADGSVRVIGLYGNEHFGTSLDITEYYCSAGMYGCPITAINEADKEEALASLKYDDSIANPSDFPFF